jgi:predicted O-linked N-acetylglucosamine transferase (SPINDLY family)
LHRLARVQATYFASPVTTGMRHMDYYISGSLTKPAQGAQEHYREKLVTVEGTGFCFNYSIQPEVAGINPDRQSLGIPERAVAFISWANLLKIIPEVRETWAKILAAVPDSVLVLYPFSPTWSNSYSRMPFVSKMRAIMEKYGVESSRLILLEALPSRALVKAVLKVADVYLDSYPYAGANSTADPLEVGVPVVVMDGNCLRARQGAALLRSLGLFDLIAGGEEEYIRLSVALGKNPELRGQWRERIVRKMQQNPSFFDSRAYSAQMGAVLQELVRMSGLGTGGTDVGNIPLKQRLSPSPPVPPLSHEELRLIHKSL